MSKEYRYWHLEYGTNTRMAALQAALGLTQLKKIQYMNKERRKILNEYLKMLRQSKLFIVWSAEKYLSIWFVNLTINPKYDVGYKLFDLANYLQKNNVETRPCFHNLSSMPIYNKFSHSSILKNMDPLNNKPSKKLRLISLPTYVGLKKEEISKICNLILQFEFKS